VRQVEELLRQNVGKIDKPSNDTLVVKQLTFDDRIGESSELVPGQRKRLTESQLASMTTIQIMKEIQKSPIKMWLASKSAKHHYLVL
jgi:hypothetical protein